MPRYTYLALVIAFISSPAQGRLEATEGKLSIFRWNQGYRAERDPVFEGNMPESEFRALVKAGRLPESEKIYAGCYLAHFQAAKITSRAPASVTDVKPKSEVFRICR